MVGCGKTVEYFSPMKYRIMPRECGSTGESGYPILCDSCERKNKDRNWRQEAIDNGENFDEEY